MKNFQLLCLATFFTTMTAMDTIISNNNSDKTVNFSNNITVLHYDIDKKYAQSIRDNIAELEKNLHKNTMKNLKSKGLTIEQVIAEEQERNDRRKRKVEFKNLEIEIKNFLKQEDCFYKQVATYSLKTSLIIGSIYILSNYTSNYLKKK